MATQLERLGVSFELFDAVDGRMLARERVAAYSRPEALKSIGRDLSLGEIGCALSHIALWQRVVDQQIDEVLILEDDIRIGGGLLEVLANRDRLPADYEMMNFRTDTSQKPFGPLVAESTVPPVTTAMRTVSVVTCSGRMERRSSCPQPIR